jgi:serine/threonine protein kinase, bacterial
VRIIDQVAKALHALHEVGLFHRGVKPSNILLDEDDFAYLNLIDLAAPAAVVETGLTSTGATIGSSWYYMAPERFTSEGVDARSDIYALACALYECLTTEHAFRGDGLEQQIENHLITPPPRPSSINPVLRGFRQRHRQGDGQEARRSLQHRGGAGCVRAIRCYPTPPPAYLVGAV